MIYIPTCLQLSWDTRVSLSPWSWTCAAAYVTYVGTQTIHGISTFQLVQTAHTKPSSSNLLGEKGDILQVCCYFQCQAFHVLPCDLYLCCSTWMGLNRYFHQLFTWSNCLSLYLHTLSAEKSCGSDWMIRNLGEPFIESRILIQIYSRCKDRIFVGLP